VGIELSPAFLEQGEDGLRLVPQADGLRVVAGEAGGALERIGQTRPRRGAGWLGVARREGGGGWLMVERGDWGLGIEDWGLGIARPDSRHIVGRRRWRGGIDLRAGWADQHGQDLLEFAYGLAMNAAQEGEQEARLGDVSRDGGHALVNGCGGSAERKVSDTVKGPSNERMRAAEETDFAFPGVLDDIQLGGQARGAGVGVGAGRAFPSSTLAMLEKRRNWRASEPASRSSATSCWARSSTWSVCCSVSCSALTVPKRSAPHLVQGLPVDHAKAQAEPVGHFHRPLFEQGATLGVWKACVGCGSPTNSNHVAG
jgi:hypothetical protein